MGPVDVHVVYQYSDLRFPVLPGYSSAPRPGIGFLQSVHLLPWARDVMVRL